MNIDAITSVLEDALRQFESKRSNGNERLDPQPFQNALLEHECSIGVVKVLESQAEFSTPLMINSLNGNSSFAARFVGPLLLRHASQQSSAGAAVKWLQKVLETKSGNGIAVQTLWGLKLERSVKLLGDIELVPFDSLPASRQKEQLSSPGFLEGTRIFTPIFAWLPPSAALVVPYRIEPYLMESEEVRDPFSGNSSDVNTRFADVRLSLSTIGPTIIISGPAWFQYIDADLEAAIIAPGTMHSYQEVLPINFPLNTSFDSSQASEVVSDFMKLAPGLKNKIRIAIERMHKSLVRHSPAEKSLELAIALETLFVDYPGEHIFKIGLRAALMAADTVEERSRIRSIIAAAYGIRNALMHSGNTLESFKVKGYGDVTATKIAAEAAQITALVIRRILSEGRLPDWSSLELSGGSLISLDDLKTARRSTGNE